MFSPNMYNRITVNRRMKTETLTQRRKARRKAWNCYVTTRYAYCAGRATIRELAHALAVVGVADAKLDIAQAELSLKCKQI